jgi:hypothetical protein
MIVPFTVTLTGIIDHEDGKFAASDVTMNPVAMFTTSPRFGPKVTVHIERPPGPTKPINQVIAKWAKDGKLTLPTE